MRRRKKESPKAAAAGCCLSSPCSEGVEQQQRPAKPFPACDLSPATRRARPPPVPEIPTVNQSRSVAALAAAGGGATSLCRGWIAAAGAEAAAASSRAAAEGAAAATAADAAAAVAMVGSLRNSECAELLLCLGTLCSLTRGGDRWIVYKPSED